MYERYGHFCINIRRTNPLFSRSIIYGSIKSIIYFISPRIPLGTFSILLSVKRDKAISLKFSTELLHNPGIHKYSKVRLGARGGFTSTD